MQMRTAIAYLYKYQTLVNLSTEPVREPIALEHTVYKKQSDKHWRNITTGVEATADAVNVSQFLAPICLALSDQPCRYDVLPVPEETAVPDT